MQNLLKNWGKGAGAEVFGFSKVNGEIFIVKHTAMDVTYSIKGFRGKNKDEVPVSVERCIEESGNQNLVGIWRIASLV